MQLLSDYFYIAQIFYILFDLQACVLRRFYVSIWIGNRWFKWIFCRFYGRDGSKCTNREGWGYHGWCMMALLCHGPRPACQGYMKYLTQCQGYCNLNIVEKYRSQGSVWYLTMRQWSALKCEAGCFEHSDIQENCTMEWTILNWPVNCTY